MADRRDDVRQVRAVISGRVQGVGFRDWTAREATALKLDGWVRNRHDASVEAVFRGEEEAVEAMLSALRTGPSSARVKSVAVEPWPDKVPTGFSVRETA